jgi:hypothetical protein
MFDYCPTCQYRREEVRIVSWLDSPKWASTSSLSSLHDQTQQDSSGRVIRQLQTPPPDNTPLHIIIIIIIIIISSSSSSSSSSRMLLCHNFYGGRDSSVSIAARYELDAHGFEP